MQFAVFAGKVTSCSIANQACYSLIGRDYEWEPPYPYYPSWNGQFAERSPIPVPQAA